MPVIAHIPNGAPLDNQEAPHLPAEAGQRQSGLLEKPLPAKTKKLSKKEKRFQLSKDDGTYSELSPISPLVAKSEFGDSLRLNPVGPAFASSNSTTAVGGAVTAHNCPDQLEKPVAGEEDMEQFMGSYYVLEVGNFHGTSAQEPTNRMPVRPSSDRASKGEREEERRGGVEGEEGRRVEEEEGEGLVAAYYMLDIHNFSASEVTSHPVSSPHGEEEGRRGGEGGGGRASAQSHHSSKSSVSSYENVATSPVRHSQSHSVYMNVTVKSPPPPLYENISRRSGTAPPHSAPVAIPKVVGNGEGRGVGDRSGATVVRTMSTSLPSESSGVARSQRERGGELDDRDKAGKGHGLSYSSDSVQTAGRKQEEEERERERERERGQASRQRQRRREEVYEVTSLSFRKKERQKSAPGPVEGGGDSAAPVANHLDSGRGVVEEEARRREEEEGGKGRREEEEEEDGVVGDREERPRGRGGGGEGQEGGGRGGGGEGQEGGGRGGGGEGQGTEPSTQLIEANGSPFAGLVISSSVPLDDGLPATAEVEVVPSSAMSVAVTDQSGWSPVLRQRTETIWDDERVQSEWSKVRGRERGGGVTL